MTSPKAARDASYFLLAELCNSWAISPVSWISCWFDWRNLRRTPQYYRVMTWQESGFGYPKQISGMEFLVKFRRVYLGISVQRVWKLLVFVVHIEAIWLHKRPWSHCFLRSAGQSRGASRKEMLSLCPQRIRHRPGCGIYSIASTFCGFPASQRLKILDLTVVLESFSLYCC